MAGEHSRPVEGGRGVWLAERLWTLARELPVREVPIASIAEFDQNCWFRPQTPPTCRAIAEHARRINAADLAFPIILAADGGLMDGGHRIAKAWLLGHATIAAVRFVQTPEPDYIIPAPDEA
ncbi:MAG TPA: hypothetical protein VIL85_27905 [Thermomicrobiales bacterium]|jgi:hypothetical protein